MNTRLNMFRMLAQQLNSSAMIASSMRVAAFKPAQEKLSVNGMQMLVRQLNMSAALRESAVNAVPKKQLVKGMELRQGYTDIRKKMAHYQVQDGVPVHLKGGAVDAMLYGFTWFVNIIGIIMVINVFYTMANK